MLHLSVAIAALMLSSCVTDDAPSVAPQPSTVLSRSNSVSKVIDVATAEHVAEKFSTIPVDGVERTAKSVVNTVTINNADGVPVMYAVNFAENGGYVIVSASKATSPIIAYSETGSYNQNQIGSGIRKMMNKISSRISDTLSYPSDSINIDWYRYLPTEKKAFKTFGAYSSPDSYAIIANVVEQWIQMGYEVCPVQQWSPGGWPMYRELVGLDKMLERLTIPVNWAGGVPANQLCYIVIQTNEAIFNSDDKCMPLTTRWNENEPFNAAVPGGMMLSPESVVLGQMLHYKNDPSVMVHSRSESHPLQDNIEISTFLYDVAKNIKTVFGINGSHSSVDNLADALSDCYGYDFALSQPSENALISSIDKGSPVMVVGYNEKGDSEAWICSRYQRRDINRKYVLMAPLGQPEGIFGPYEACAQWDNNGGANFYFDNSGDDLYFCTFANFKNWDTLYTNGLVFFGEVFKKNTSS